MDNFSENWPLLHSILVGFSTRHRAPEVNSYEEHRRSKALSIFLSAATLATPKLDRETVESVLKGEELWPHIDNLSMFGGVDTPLSLLETNGLISFSTNWCSVHSNTINDLDLVDPSLVPLIQALEHLKDINWGRNGYIQPHFKCPKDELGSLLKSNLGSSNIAEIIPELQLNDGHYHLLPGNQYFCSLTSTNLWLELRKNLEPEQAFKKWILCLRVNCSWGMPLLFENLEYSERTTFIKQLLKYLSKDMALCIPIDSLHKQAINQAYFSRIIAPVNTNLQLAVDLKSNRLSEQKLKGTIEPKRPTIASLSAAYQLPCTSYSNDLQLVQMWNRTRHCREPESFYTNILNNVIETCISINGQMLASSDLLEELLELATSRPILKHILLNSVTQYESFKYLIFLLSQKSTSDIALFYLARKSFTDLNPKNHSFTEHFQRGYQQLVCYEYFRSIEKESENGERLLKVAEFLAERCNLNEDNFAQSSEYSFLICFLDRLSNSHIIQIGQALNQLLTASVNHPDQHSSKHYWYLLGFWLLERLEVTGIDSNILDSSLKKSIHLYYKAEFNDNFAGNQRSLNPNVFFSVLPWHKLIEKEEPSQVLSLSNDCYNWGQELHYSNKINFTVASAIRHYLQVLMCIGRHQSNQNILDRVSARVAEIARILGVDRGEEATNLFDSAFYTNEFDLWTPFCSYTNLFNHSLYDDFIERCQSLIPLDQLFALLERCTIIARARKLEGFIASRQSQETEGLGLSALEQAFISAWNSDHTILASKLLADAKKLLSQGHFANSKNSHILNISKSWLNYDYKYRLRTLHETFEHQPDEFQNAAYKVPLPHEKNYSLNKECEQFRRYVIAAAHCETNPEKSVEIMEHLHKESKDSNHSFLLFQARLAFLQQGSNKTQEIRHSLVQFLLTIDKVEPEDMPTQWVRTILNAYQQLNDASEIDAFWMKLNSEQKDRLEILHPYCLALMERGEALIAQQIINRYCEINQQRPDGLELNDLIDKLAKALPTESSMTQLIQFLNEGSQRNVTQLAKHYNQIVSQEFEQYVSIVGQGLSSHEFLKNIIEEVANELLLRKKNLQIHSMKNNKTTIRITKEDLINDWFVSLFDKRLAEARLGLRDQKRGGKSASGKSPGEIDGYITDSKNKRLAIFEAFRLFSIDTTVIGDHLDKLAGYDNESLSPVFIVAYCDVNNFSALCDGYSQFISQKDYKGFTIDRSSNFGLHNHKNNNDLYLGMERRYRKNQEIIFYHLLLNMK